jgi:hypothetical protein
LRTEALVEVVMEAVFTTMEVTFIDMVVMKFVIVGGTTG